MRRDFLDAFFILFLRLCKTALEVRDLFGVGCGLILGLAELSKYVWIILYPLWIALWIIWKLMERRKVTQSRILSAGIHFALIVFLSICVINAGYFFHDSFQPASESPFINRVLDWFIPNNNEVTAQSKNATGPWFHDVPVPLPVDYLQGMNEIASVFGRPRSTYVGGEFHPGGTWYFYLYGLLVKLPLGLWIIILVACYLTLSDRRFSREIRNEMLLIISIIEILCFVTIVTTIQYVRYALPVLPLIFVWASKAALTFDKNHRCFGVLVSVALVWVVGSCLWNYPHSLSYFNELAGGQ